MEILYTTNGYDIVEDGKILLSVPSNPAGVEWTDVEKTAEAEAMLADIFNQKYIVPLVKRISAQFEHSVRSLDGSASAFEKETWTKQELEAIAYTVDPTSETPLLDILTESNGITKEVLAAKIIVNANEYNVAIGKLLGLKQKLIKEANSVTNLEELALVASQLQVDLDMQ